MKAKRSSWSKSGSVGGEDRMELSKLGNVVVRDREYMRKLHERPRPVALGIAEPAGGLELHHGPSLGNVQRRANDAAVIPLHAFEHLEIEQNMGLEEQFRLPFGLWAAFNYWCHKTGTDPESHNAGQAFLDWSLRRLMEES